MDTVWSPSEKAMVLKMLRLSFVGDQSEIEEQLKSFQEKFQVDELMVNSHVFDHEKRLQSYQIIRNAVDALPIA